MNNKLALRTYWRILIALIGAIIILKIVLRFNNASSNLMLITFFVYMLTWPILIIINFYNSYVISSYVETKYGQKLYFTNTFKFFDFIFSDKNYEDGILQSMKNGYKRFLFFCLTVFFTYPMIFLLLMVV